MGQKSSKRRLFELSGGYLSEEYWQKHMCVWHSRDHCYVDAGQSCCDDCSAFQRIPVKDARAMYNWLQKESNKTA
jgi:hypothetical protein